MNISNSPKGRVPRACPWVNVRGGDTLVNWVNGNPAFWTWCLSNRVPYYLDTKVSSPHPESWRSGLFAQTFSENSPEHAWMWNHWAKYPGWSYPFTYGYTSEICSKWCCGSNKRDYIKPPSEKVWLVKKSVLEREYSLVPWVFCFYRWCGWGKNHKVHPLATKPGFRSSEAWIFLSATGLPVGIYRDKSLYQALERH